jgi:hypothetical protein
MPTSVPGNPREEAARIGHDIYLRTILPRASPEDVGKYVLIGVLSGMYVVDDADLTSSRRLRAHCPEDVFWKERLGEPTAVRFSSLFSVRH